MNEPKPVQSADDFFAGSELGREAYDRLETALQRLGDFSVRVTAGQVAFRRRRGFAYLWLPGRWLRNPQAEVVLSLALPREDASPRFKQVAHPAPGTWMHHLELQAADNIDGEVLSWLREAYDAAA